MKPFKQAQLFLEGDKYSCIATVPNVITSTFKTIQKHVNDFDNGSEEQNLCKNISQDVTNRWGDVNNPTNRLFCEEVNRGRGNRQIGSHPIVCLCHFLDPRFKDLKKFQGHPDGIPATHDFVLKKMIEVSSNLSNEQIGCKTTKNLNSTDLKNKDNDGFEDANNSNDAFTSLFFGSDRNNQFQNDSDDDFLSNECDRDTCLQNLCEKEIEQCLSMPTLPPTQRNLQNNQKIEHACPLRDWWRIH